MIDLPPLDVGSVVTVAVFVVLGAAFVIGALVGSHRELRERADQDRKTLRDLEDLDPPLLAVLGRDARYGDWANRDRILDAAKIGRLAETQRTLSHRATSSHELDAALAALREARA